MPDQLLDRDGDESFSLICALNGRIRRWIEPGLQDETVNTLQLLFVAESQAKLLQLLHDARKAATCTVLQLEGGNSTHVYGAAVSENVLIVSADRPSAVRDAAERVATIAPEAAGAAAAIIAAATPDRATLELWDEVSRLNNDLTTLHRQVAKQNAELRWLNERKNQLLGMAAHDLRNPIGAIIMLANFIGEGEKHV